MRSPSLLALPAVFALSAVAAAQDFGTEWIDRVTRQMVQERGPLSPRPVDLHLTAGERVYFDDNVFLESGDESSDTIFVTYGGLRLDYTETNFDATLDALVNYSHYVHEDDASDDEERIMGRLRYVAAHWQIEVAEVLRRESDPFTDAAIAERIERIVSDTSPRVLVGVTNQLSIEARGNIEYVDLDEGQFDENTLDGRILKANAEATNNINYRASLMGIYELPTGYDVLVDVGYLGINYRESEVSVAGSTFEVLDVQGFFARGGFRGDLQQQRMTLSILAGVTSAKTENPSGPGDADEHMTADVESYLRFEPNQQTGIYASYARRIGFGFGEAFQVVNRIIVGVDYTLNPRTKANLRGQYDYIHGISGLNRDYASIGGDITYQLLQWLVLDAGLTWRTGNIKDDGDGDFNNLIASVGAAARW